MYELANTFTWDEIVEDISKFLNFKSPGPDDCTHELIKANILLLKNDLLAFFSELHGHKLDLQGINRAFIALLLKVECPRIYMTTYLSPWFTWL